MSIKGLRSWQIPKTQPFYPIGLQYIGVDDDWAISTYAHHTVNTHIFRNFKDAISNDKPPHKTYLHTSLFPDRIQDVIVGDTESTILLSDGRIMYFSSPKKLMTVKYLSGIKTICCCRNGFAMIRMSNNGSEFFVEIHPDAFQGQATEVDGRKTYNITFDKVPGLETTWHQTRFKIKELRINRNENDFLKNIFPEDVLANDVDGDVNMDGVGDRFLFVSMDKTFCSLHVQGDEHVVNPITMCDTKIVDFWAGEDGEKIFLLLDIGALEILYLKRSSNEITKQTFYFGSELMCYHFHGDVFFYSNGTQLEYGPIKFNEKSEKYSFDRKTLAYMGVAAMSYLPEHQFLLFINENRLFYRIPIEIPEKKNKKSEWIELNEETQNSLQNVKFNLKELTEVYDSLLQEQHRQQKMLEIIKLKKNDQKAIDAGDKNLKYRFVAKCSVSRTPPIQRHNDLFTNIVNIENPLPYDRTKSYFVNMTIAAVTYANEFDNDLWHLSCRWLNDKCENEYANNRLANGMLAEPLTFIIHLQEQRLPEFQLSIETYAVINSKRSIHVEFQVRVDQPDYCEMMDVAIRNTKPTEIDANSFKLLDTIYVPKTVSMNDLISDKLVPINEVKNVSSEGTVSSPANVFGIYLLGLELTAIHYDENETLRLLTNDANLLCAFKKHVYKKIESKLNALGQTFNAGISADVLKAYRVSARRTI